MKITCKEISCQNSSYFQKDGHYFRRSDSKFIQRYRCKLCGKRTSSAQLSLAYGQKKRTVNKMIESLLCAKVSQRRIAKILKIDKKTVHRKIIFLGNKARESNKLFLSQLDSQIESFELDDLVTKECTKLKPVTITVAVDPLSRKILALKAAQVPAFGHLAKLSVQKYGKRKNEHKIALDNVFGKLYGVVKEDALIKTDKHKLYKFFIERYFPKAEHLSFKSEKACIAGQGELKKIKKDPIYYINHTFAMMRDNINRLVRRSWCVTQDIEMLQHHLEIYMKYHNTELV